MACQGLFRLTNSQLLDGVTAIRFIGVDFGQPTMFQCRSRLQIGLHATVASFALSYIHVTNCHIGLALNTQSDDEGVAAISNCYFYDNDRGIQASTNNLLVQHTNFYNNQNPLYASAILFANPSQAGQLMIQWCRFLYVNWRQSHR
jgi:hypothetical protein